MCPNVKASVKNVHPVVKLSWGLVGPRLLELSVILALAPSWWAPAAAANAVWCIFAQLNDVNTSTADVSSERPSVVYLSSVAFMHPTQPVEIFHNFSSPSGTLDIR